MEINISPELSTLIPHFKIGVITYHDIQVGKSPQMVKGRLQLFQESLYFDYEDKKVTEIEAIQEWRQIFKACGKDPNRYRHSAEALFRRVIKQNYLQSVHSAIDLNNFFSLKYQVPIGIYDADKLSGPVQIRLGEENESYIGLNGRENSVHRLLVAADEAGPFGSPFVDSERTAVTEETVNALQIVFHRPSITVEEAEEMTVSLKDMFLQVHGGTGEVRIID
ncbi:B3/4 domain-containing protein [Cytobacillus gottheilii]|uniref:B3/B4 domain-containing protein n=1 Tax=Cytobacillus gottheilii TaxID=859144 RepID=UPI00082BB36E|nr:phenylalanine--tRNA ligase beta subunit-related protein [Cytobacillus gottheilii]